MDTVEHCGQVATEELLSNVIEGVYRR